MQLLQKYLDINHSPDRRTFRRQLIAFAHHMDFPLVSAVLMGDHADALDDHALYVGNRPTDFVGDSFDPKYITVDPVLARLRQSNEPFLYDQKFYVNNGASELWEHAAPWGFRTGISVSIKLPNDKIFLLGLDRERELPGDEKKIQRMLTDLQLFAAFAQDAADRLLTPRQEGVVNARLSIKEREILLRILEGRSNWTIAQLMSVSENTVKFHLKAIYNKLGVSSRVAAATKASSFGML